MPTILRVGAYRFFFYAGDRDEPFHVHVEREDNIVKFWIDPVRLQRSGGFRRPEIIRIAKIMGRKRGTDHVFNYVRKPENVVCPLFTGIPTATVPAIPLPI